MWKKEVKTNLSIFVKAGLPYTLGGMAVVFAGLYFIKQIFGENEYLTYILFAWLAIFWLIYQPLFKNQITKTKMDPGPTQVRYIYHRFIVLYCVIAYCSILYEVLLCYTLLY